MLSAYLPTNEPFRFCVHIISWSGFLLFGTTEARKTLFIRLE